MSCLTQLQRKKKIENHDTRYFPIIEITTKEIEKKITSFMHRLDPKYFQKATLDKRSGTSGRQTMHGRIDKKKRKTFCKTHTIFSFRLESKTSSNRIDILKISRNTLYSCKHTYTNSFIN